MQLFYSSKILSNLIILDETETNHCMNVLRYKVGDTIYVVDGMGSLYTSKIVELKNNECCSKIINRKNSYNNNGHKVHIAISCLKNHKRLEFFIEKSVEIGIDEISLIDCNRTVRNKCKIDRLKKTAIVAMKQTLKSKLPIINPIKNIKDFINESKDENKFICHLEYDLSKTITNYKSKFKNANSSCILIGPEGDFTKEEINLAESNGFLSISLGNNRLRSETAGIVACHLLNIANNY